MRWAYEPFEIAAVAFVGNTNGFSGKIDRKTHKTKLSATPPFFTEPGEYVTCFAQAS